MPTPLFDMNHRYTQTALDFENEIYQAIRPIMDRYIQAGFSPRDLFYLAQMAASDISLCALFSDRLNDNPSPPVSTT